MTASGSGSASCPDSAHFDTRSGLDLEARDRWFAQAIVTSPAMFRRTAGAGSLYWLGTRDRSGAYLDGGKNYKLPVPLPVPAGLFWSVTAYDAATRSEVQTDQDKAALRSLFELKDVSGNAVDLYFGPNAPAGKESRWIKTAPGKGWFAYFRIYGPKGPPSTARGSRATLKSRNNASVFRRPSGLSSGRRSTRS